MAQLAVCIKCSHCIRSDHFGGLSFFWVEVRVSDLCLIVTILWSELVLGLVYIAFRYCLNLSVFRENRLIANDNTMHSCSKSLLQSV